MTIIRSLRPFANIGMSSTSTAAIIENWSILTQDATSTFSVGGVNSREISGFVAGQRYSISITARMSGVGGTSAGQFQFAEAGGALIAGALIFPHSQSETTDDTGTNSVTFVYAPTTNASLEVRRVTGDDGFIIDATFISIMQVS